MTNRERAAELVRFSRSFDYASQTGPAVERMAQALSQAEADALDRAAVACDDEARACDSLGKHRGGNPPENATLGARNVWSAAARKIRALKPPVPKGGADGR